MNFVQFYRYATVLLLLLFAFSKLFPQENQTLEPTQNPDKKETTPEKNPHYAALLGIVPGVGQAYIGNYYTGAAQAGTFLSIYNLERYYRSQPDYISYKDREVKFDFNDAVVGYTFQKNGWVYNDLPLKAAVQENDQYKNLSFALFSETRYDRDLRLWKERQLAEENTFIKYGTYSRTSRNTVYADMLNNPVLSTMMYSIYSAYRDAGALGDTKKSETLAQIAYAPFNPDILKKPEVYIPITILGGFFALYSKSGNPILVPSSVKRDGSLYMQAFTDGISPAIGEEAFFRGYLNHTLTTNYGPVAGIGTSSLLFMLAHEGNSDAREGRIARYLAGIYFGWIHYKNGYDIRPGTAVHFWNNFFIGLAAMSQYKADPNYDKGQRDVFFMPIQFTFNL
ncbi:MAG TPA: CPBP family intramembrane metalloprotease [Leptospiraceae bacterium]|nr:CPBP family intramembrane metalloprotease [Leptospiraceae bacterium]HMW05164.1 CPBP family intramembrane metalloprotease [Leptospiraceae bacterium]HMX32575.1 CPBP family intramembrane metalloprotease [Leptospiraceae bacterium]HMY32503.1 CPBP family intramembrane metalloprotease [Leptospiraceae bacterium]HMZ67407.1 CPBP family intramembrane metalloprotease [Leptospiraceae bacterium]